MAESPQSSSLSSPLDELLSHFQSRVHDRRKEASERAVRLHEAVDRYFQALEYELACELAVAHQLKRPAPTGPAPDTAARALLALVSALPELAHKPEQQAPKAERPAEAKAPAAAAVRPAASTPVRTRKFLAKAVIDKPLVVVGGLGKKESPQSLASEVPTNTEWIDTRKDGFKAIGNLDRRVRDGRIAALVLLEGSLGHKHTDPLVGAAREKGVPYAYANKGGKASLLRALDELEQILGRRRS